MGHIVSDTPKKHGETQCIGLKKREEKIVLPLIYYGGILCLQLRKPSHKDLLNMGKNTIFITPGTGWDPSMNENDDMVPGKVAIKQEDNEAVDV